MKGLNYHKEMLEDSLAMALSIDIYIFLKQSISTSLRTMDICIYIYK
jgi:hypothetical protein